MKSVTGHLIGVAVASLVAVSSVALAQQAPRGPSQAQIDAAKNAAAGVAGSLGNQNFAFGADGSVQKNSDGTAKTDSNSQAAMENSLKRFQGMTGLGGVEQITSPGKASGMGAANIEINSQFDFSCAKAATGRTFAAGSLALRITSCSKAANGVVSGVNIRICENMLNAGVCVKDSDFTRALTLAPGAFTSSNSIQYGLGCNADALCRISVKGAQSVSGNDASMKEGAQSAAAQPNSLVGTLRGTVVQHDYAGKMQEIGTDMQACSEMNRTASADGRVYTCDGSRSVGVSNGQAGASCEGTRQCLSEKVEVQRFTQKCVRTIPLTERVTTYQFSGNRVCDIRIATNQDGTTSTTNSCGNVSGLALAWETERTCTNYRTEQNGSRTCIEVSYKQYMANTTNGQVLNQTASPAPVGGACDTNPASETRYLSCRNGNWFARFLPDSACKVNYTDEATGQVTGAEDVDFLKKPGCGWCETPTVGETCYAVPAASAEQSQETGQDMADSCATMPLAGCTLTSTNPIGLTGAGGLVSEQEEVYSCRKEQRICLQWGAGSGENACYSSDYAFGMDRFRSRPADDGSLNAAMVAAGMMDSTAKGVEGSQTQQVPKIFTGENQKCQRPVGGIGNLLARNCCRISLERPIRGNVVRDGCTLDESKLAAARRSSYAHYVGEYCSRKMSFPRKCIERKQSYCVFEGILPKLVQQQGRQQLANMVATGSGADIQRAQLTYRYIDNGQGKWSAPVTVNGVRVVGWQWPQYCENPEEAAQTLVTDPEARSCPGVVRTVIAACDKAAGCGELPDDPEDGSVDWTLKDIDPLRNITTAVSTYSAVAGACSPQSGSCQYTISAWPVGVGGKAVVSKDILWELYSTEQIADSGQAARDFTMNNIGDFMFKGFSTGGSSSSGIPATVRLDFSKDGGQTWTSHSIPTEITGSEYSVPGTDVKLTGKCDAFSNLCAYRATGTVTVTAKPWGAPKNPDCTGFTVGQLSVLDFGKMDLSEWLDSVLAKAEGDHSRGELAALAQAQFSQFNGVFNSGAGTVSQASTVSANFARAIPSEGFGPFDVKLAVGGFWPEVTGDPAKDTDRVTRVEVDWGDCSATQTLSAIPATQGSGYTGTHRYLTPDDDRHACLYPREADRKRNISHKIVITAYTTKSGTQTRTISVENAWSVFPGGQKNNDHVEQRKTVPANQSGAPQAPTIQR